MSDPSSFLSIETLVGRSYYDFAPCLEKHSQRAHSVGRSKSQKFSLPKFWPSLFLFGGVLCLEHYYL